MNPLHAIRDAKSADGVSLFDLPAVVYEVVPDGEGWRMVHVPLCIESVRTATVTGFINGMVNVDMGRTVQLSALFSTVDSATRYIAKLYADHAGKLLANIDGDAKAVTA